MKVVFAGTPEFAAYALRAIEAAGHTVVLVMTQPDRRAGRGMQMQASAVKEFALSKSMPLLQVSSLKRSSADPQKKEDACRAYKTLNQTEFDVMVVVAYGLIIPQDILDITERQGRYGAFNIHGSLLPRWRGAAPIQRAIEAGDLETGITIMRMDAGLDTGDTVLLKAIPILPNETSADLHDRLAKLGAELMMQCLAQLESGKVLIRTQQPSEGVCYAEKIQKAEAEIDWNQSARCIDRRIRAFNPFPGASTLMQGQAIKVWRSSVAAGTKANAAANQSSPGTIIGKGDKGVLVACGEGVLEVEEIQKPGGKRVPALQWLQSEQAQQTALQFIKATP